MAFAVLVALSTGSGVAQDVGVSEALTIAERLFYRRAFVDSEVVLRRAMVEAPDDASIQYALVRSLLRQKRLEEAQRVARDGVDGAPRSPAAAPAHVGMGDVLYRRARFEEAESHYRTAVDLDPELARAHLGLGKVLETASLRRSARLQFERAFEIDPGDPDVLWALSRVTGDRQHILRLLEDYLALATYEEPRRLDSVRDLLHVRQVLGNRGHCRARGSGGPYEAKLLPFRHGARAGRGQAIALGLNGKKPIRLLLDTAASGILVGRRYAEKSGVLRLGSASVSGIGEAGPRAAYFALAQTVEVGDLVFEDCLVQVIEQQVWSDGDGIVGTALFANFVIDLDIGGNGMALVPQPPLGAGGEGAEYDHDALPLEDGFVPIRVLNEDLMLLTRVNGDHDAHFLVDTGATANLLSKHLADRVTTTRRSRRSVTGLSGEVRDVEEASGVRLEYAGHDRVSRSVVVVDLSERNWQLGVETGGILGYEALGRMRLVIDYRNGWIRLLDSGSKR